MPPRWSAPSGRPGFSAAWRSIATVLCCALLTLCPASFAQELPLTEAHSADESSFKQLRLRVYCDTGGAEATWSGSASLTQGRLLDVRPLGSGHDTAVLARSTSQGVAIQSLSRRRIVAFDVTAVGPTEAEFLLQLTTNGGQPVEVRAVLSELSSQPKQTALGEAGTVQVFRAADDRLRVRCEREQLIFSPGEQFAFTLIADLAGVEPGSPIDLQAQVLRGRSGPETPGGQTQRTEMPLDGPTKNTFHVVLPQEEGVYTIHLSARRPAGLMRGWARNAGKPLAERSVQVVVWDANNATCLSEQERLVVEIDPTNKHWWNHIPEWKWMRKVPWLRTGPLGDAPSEIVSGAQGRLVRLPPAGDAEQVAWQAYPLPIQAIGAAHVLEVEVPDDESQELSLTIFDRNAMGLAVPLGDSMTVVSGGDRVHDDQQRIARRVFWPKTDSPMLIVSNHSDQGAALYGRVRVYSLEREPQDTPAPAMAGQRTIALCATSPHLVRTMQSATDDRYVLDDWQTCYDTAVRLADYTQAAGYNAAVVTAASAKGALCPLPLLGHSTGLDREALNSGMADLPSKDQLELLLREFDRRGLRLVVNVRLETVLPQVEAHRNDEQGGAVDCLDTSNKPVVGLGRRYNPLSKTVRRELLSVVQQIAQRGAGHPSFAGVAIDLRPECHVALPGDLACADSQTVARFQQENNLAWPADAPRTSDHVSHALLTAWNKAWRDWRARQMTALYGEMARRVAQVDQEARLWLMTEHLLADEAGREAVRPSLEGRPKLESLLVERGLDRERLAMLPNVTIVAPREGELPGQLMRAALPMALSDLHWRDSARQGSPQAAHLLGAWRRANLMGFKAQSPFGVDRTYTSTTLAHVTVGTRGAEKLLNAVIDSPDGELLSGGDANPLSLDKDLSQTRRALQALPPATAGKAAAQQPLTVQVVNGPRDTVLLAGNRSPWPLTAAITVDSPASCSIERLSPGAGATRLGVGKHALPLELPPFGLHVFRVDCPDVTAVGVRTEEQQEAQQALAKEVQRLASRDLSARRPFKAVRNPSFEELDPAGMPAAWRPAAGTPSGGVAINQQSAVDGQSALQITAGPQPVRMSTEPFAPPATRQLVMTFYVRAERLAPGGVLRVVYKGNDSHEAVTTIPAAALKVGQDWRQFVFAQDLPLESEGPMQIAFEARDMSVSIDKLELDELAFPMNFALPAASARQRLELVKLVQSAKIALDEGRTADCRDILDGYWPRFLSEFTPIVPPKIAQAPAKQEEQAKEEPAPEVGGRWKSYVPGFLRFF